MYEPRTRLYYFKSRSLKAYEPTSLQAYESTLRAYSVFVPYHAAKGHHRLKGPSSSETGLDSFYLFKTDFTLVDGFALGKKKPGITNICS